MLPALLVLAVVQLVPLPGAELSALERWAVFTAAVTAGLLALGAIATRVVRGIRRARAWIREGLRRADALDRLVQHELHPNHGGSLHDKVGNLDKRLVAVESSLTTMARSSANMWPAIEAIAQAEPPKERNNH